MAVSKWLEIDWTSVEAIQGSMTSRAIEMLGEAMQERNSLFQLVSSQAPTAFESFEPTFEPTFPVNSIWTYDGSRDPLKEIEFLIKRSITKYFDPTKLIAFNGGDRSLNFYNTWFFSLEKALQYAGYDTFYSFTDEVAIGSIPTKKVVMPTAEVLKQYYDILTQMQWCTGADSNITTPVTAYNRDVNTLEIKGHINEIYNQAQLDAAWNDIIAYTPTITPSSASGPELRCSGNGAAASVDIYYLKKQYDYSHLSDASGANMPGNPLEVKALASIGNFPGQEDDTDLGYGQLENTRYFDEINLQIDPIAKRYTLDIGRNTNFPAAAPTMPSKNGYGIDQLQGNGAIVIEFWDGEGGFEYYTPPEE